MYEVNKGKILAIDKNILPLFPPNGIINEKEK